MAHIAFMLAVLVLVFTGRTEAITAQEEIAFAGVDTLNLRAYPTGCEDLVSEQQLLTKAEYVLRTAGVPVDDNFYARAGGWLAIHATCLKLNYKDGTSTGAWAWAVEAGLNEAVPIWRDGVKEFLSVVTWKSHLNLFIGPKQEARNGLLNHIAEIAEKFSNLYLATRDL